MKARPVSAFDPSGFIIVISFLLLLVGVIAATARALVSHHGLVLRSRVEKNLQDMSDYVSDQRNRVGENLQYFKAVIAGWRTPNVVILDLAKQNTNVKTLPDLGHDLFKFVMTKIYGHTTYIEWFDLPDEFLAAVGTLTSFILILHPRRLLIIRRFCFIFAIINLMRACCVAVTSLPDASPMCISQFDTDRGNYKPLPIFPKAFFRAWKVLIRPSQHITCGDMIFSGHAVFLILCCMFARTYCVRSEFSTPFTRRFPSVLWMIRYYNYILSAFGIFAIVGTRLHYTLDVLIAIYITIQVWLTYHWLMNHPEDTFALIKWLEHAEVHLVDHNAYQKARRFGTQSDRVDKID
ncbi:unnamed protein product [Peronospora belbahrii]|uniref:Sphingomyelin synthase-like domain-containing protein n=1 Tax=Peronospora belbahrii TaxID=622444 RepID=A0ABN8CSB8_9STRA|nr:unnamed protein product [Peronospora belbahrii]